MKECGICKIEKPLTEFHFRNKKKGTRKSWCKLCNRNYDAKWYKSQPEDWKKKKREKDNQRRREQRLFVWNYLLKNPCECGENHPILLEFDHTDKDEKFDEVSNMIRRGYSLTKIKEEIDKCIVRCVKCHRLKTAKEDGWYKEFNWHDGV